MTNASRKTKLRFPQSCTLRRLQIPLGKVAIHTRVGRETRCMSAQFLYQLFPISPYKKEPMHEFFSRRHRAAYRLTGSSGKWSKLWRQDLLGWQAHMKRQYDVHVWKPYLLSWKGGDWLGIQRLLNSAFGESRTNTRAYRGHVHRRWEDGLERRSQLLVIFTQSRLCAARLICHWLLSHILDVDQ